MGLFSAQLDGNCLVIKQVQNGKEKKIKHSGSSSAIYTRRNMIKSIGILWLALLPTF